MDEVDSSVWLITNRHLFVSRDSVLISSYKYRRVDSSVAYSSPDTRVYWKKVKHFCPTSEDSDFVAVSVPDSVAEAIGTPLNQSNTVAFEDLRYGEQVVFYGYPKYDELGLFWGNAKFPVARSGALAFFASEEIEASRDSRPYLIPGMFLIDGLSIPGNSGGPVYVRRPFPNTQRGISYDRRCAGVIVGHLSSRQSLTVPLSQTRFISKALENVRTSEDSLLVSQALSDLQIVVEDDLHMARAVSMTVIVDYINRRLTSQ